MTTVKTTLAEVRKVARVDTAKLKATTQADIERQAREDGTDDFSPFPAFFGASAKISRPDQGAMTIF